MNSILIILIGIFLFFLAPVIVIFFFKWIDFIIEMNCKKFHEDKKNDDHEFSKMGIFTPIFTPEELIYIQKLICEYGYIKGFTDIAREVAIDMKIDEYLKR